jgi:hypothetical protein
MIEGYSVRQISNHSRHKRDYLYRIINYWLGHPPGRPQGDIASSKNLIFDGTFIHQPTGMIILMDARTGKVINGKYDVRENSDRQIMAFFKPLIADGLSPQSFTIDGNPQVIRTIMALWPNIIIQRCLVHIQRQGLMWCRSYPKTIYAKKLRDIFLKVPYIRDKKGRDSLLSEIQAWEEKYGALIAAHPEKGRVFSDIKRARSMLLKALPNMFHYLEDQKIPFSTNGLEGYFSRLKGNYRQHRGIVKNKLDSYFRWYFFLKK